LPLLYKVTPCTRSSYNGNPKRSMFASSDRDRASAFRLGVCFVVNSQVQLSLAWQAIAFGAP
jgi:hypothetical protein